MNAADFAARWGRWYPQAPPVGHRLRVAHPAEWVRVHSLPDGRRYADDAVAWAEVLRRMNAVAAEVLGEGRRGVVVVPGWAAADWDGPALAPLAGLPEGGEPEDAVALHGAEIAWRTGAFDGLLRRIADDETRAVFVGLDTGGVFAPYDGGADLFLRDGAERQALRDRHRTWLSEHPSGL